MGKNIVAVIYGEPDGFHHTVTRGSAVSGVHIDVLTPEAFWTVVGIAVSCDSSTTVSTGKIFNVASKSFAHWDAPAPIFRGCGLPIV